MITSGPAVLVIASLMATIPCFQAAAAQRTPVEPAAPLDKQQTQDPEPAAQEPASGTAGRKRTGLKGLMRERMERLKAPPKTSPDAAGGFSPTAGTVVSGSGLAAGARYRSVNLLPGGIDAQVGAKVSFRGYQEYSAAIGWMDRDRSTVAFDTPDTAVASLFNAALPKAPGTAAYLDVRHRILPRQLYFGSGINSRPEDLGDYTLSGTVVDGVFQRQLTPRFGLSVRGGWMHLRASAGEDDALVDVEERFALTDLAGLVRQPAFVTLGTGVAWDARNNPRAPEQGWFTAASLRHFAPLSADGRVVHARHDRCARVSARARGRGRGAWTDLVRPGRNRPRRSSCRSRSAVRRRCGASATIASRTAPSPMPTSSTAGARIATSRLRRSWMPARSRIHGRGWEPETSR